MKAIRNWAQAAFLAFGTLMLGAVLDANATEAPKTCATCSSSARIGGSTAITSRANVSLNGVGYAYSQSAGKGYATATANTNPDTHLVGASAKTTAGTDGIVFVVGDGDYTGSSTFDGTTLAGAEAASKVDSPHYQAQVNVNADSGYFTQVGGTALALAATNGQGIAGSADTVAEAKGTADYTKSMADCVVTLIGDARTQVYADGGTRAGLVTVDGVTRPAGTVTSTAGSRAAALSDFFSK